MQRELLLVGAEAEGREEVAETEEQLLGALQPVESLQKYLKPDR